MPSKKFWKETVTIYLFCFAKTPVEHAGHYLGSAADFEARLAQHEAGHGSALMGAVVEKGIKFKVARLWKNVPRWWEVKLHRRAENKALCPVCSGKVALNRGQFNDDRRGRR